jgi:DNA-binding transcriptional LysR family regulator
MTDTQVTFDLRLLSSFVVVADELHFGRASERLQIAQPALSQQIRRLETQLGVRLFERDARRVELSGPGEAFLPGARAALQAAERAASAARAAADGAGATLCLSVDLDVPRRVLGRVHSCAAEMSDVELRLRREHQGDALASLHAGRIDLVLGWARIPHGPPVRTVAIDSAEVLAVMRRDHPEAHRDRMPRDVFAAHRFVMFSRRPTTDVFDWLVTAATGRQPEQLDIVEVPSLEDGTGAMLRAAARGPGLTLAIRDAFDSAEHPDLVAVPFDPPLHHDVTLIWLPQRESGAVTAFTASCGAASRAAASTASVA